MVLVRRKDKRRGNEVEEIAVASDSSIVANKGLRSLQSARTGRFAADMRVQVGGYGRADKTWGVDHPWHKTREEIVDDMGSRDHMEEGLRVKEEPRPEGHGLSRAALKKKKSKLKKSGLTESTAGSEMGSEVLSVVAEVKKAAKKESAVKKVEDGKPTAETRAEDEENSTVTATEENVNKKRKRVNRNKKKQKKARANAENGDSSDDNDSDREAPIEVVTKPKKQKAMVVATALPMPVVPTTEDIKKQNQADAAKREVIATQYETAFGQEFTTASGLMIRDVRQGHGRVPAIGEMLTVRYRGRIDDNNGIVFGKGMLSTTYGTGSVIAGWEEGMGTMRAGGIRHLTVPPSLAYGSVAKGTKIPPNATLFFEVEVVRVGKRKRDLVAKDEIPLPSSFQRKKSPSASTGKAKTNSSNNATAKKGKSKGRRRKHSI